MWKDGITMVTWLAPRPPVPANAVQSGLYFAGATLQDDRPKPTLSAFRFPFVAYAEAGGLLFWGRTPGGLPAQVVIERKGAGGSAPARDHAHRSLRRLYAAGRRDAAGNGFLRARLAGASSAAAASRPFSLKRPPDRFHCSPPFG